MTNPQGQICHGMSISVIVLAVFGLVVFGLVGSVFGWSDQWWFGVWVAVGWRLGSWVGVWVGRICVWVAGSMVVWCLGGCGLVFWWLDWCLGEFFLLLLLVVVGVCVVVGLFFGFVIFGS